MISKERVDKNVGSFFYILKGEKMAESILVSYEPSNGEDQAILLVGKKAPKKDVEIINAFKGKVAAELWEQLTVQKKVPER